MWQRSRATTAVRAPQLRYGLYENPHGSGIVILAIDSEGPTFFCCLFVIFNGQGVSRLFDIVGDSWRVAITRSECR